MSSLESVQFPDNFPTIGDMLEMLSRTFEKAWRLDWDISSVNSWLDNFDGECFDVKEERRLALWLLCNVTYYTEQETEDLLRLAYSNLKHRVCEDRGLSSIEYKEMEREIRFSGIGNAAESGAMLLYKFRHVNNLANAQFPKSEDFARGSINVRLDDVSLSGSTLIRSIDEGIKRGGSVPLYHLVLIASEEAAKSVEQKGASLVSCIRLDDRNKAFSENSHCFHLFPDLRLSAKTFAQHYGQKINSKAPLGFGNGQYLLGFHHNTPNNSLPIFWSSKAGWAPILKRYDKNYGAGGETDDVTTYI